MAPTLSWPSKTDFFSFLCEFHGNKTVKWRRRDNLLSRFHATSHTDAATWFSLCCCDESTRVFVFVDDLLLCPRLKGQIKATEPWPLWHEWAGLTCFEALRANVSLSNEPFLISWCHMTTRTMCFKLFALTYGIKCDCGFARQCVLDSHTSKIFFLRAARSSWQAECCSS